MKKQGMKVFLAVLVVLAFATFALAKDPKVISTPDAPAAVGPYSQGVKYGEVVYTSGQIPLTPARPGQPSVLVTSNMTAATHQVMANLKAILEEAKMDFGDVMMTTVYLRDINDFNEFNCAYGEDLGCACTYTPPSTDNTKSPPALIPSSCSCNCAGVYLPARATLQAGALPRNALLEVSMTAGK